MSGIETFLPAVLPCYSGKKSAAYAMLREIGVKELTMNKAQRCWLHLRCIATKLAKGRDIKWHVQHIIREFGFGRYADSTPWPYSNMEKCNVVLKH